MAGWMKNSGGSCWPGVMRISGSASWCFRRRDGTWPGSPTTSPRSGSEPAKITPAGLVDSSPRGLARPDAGREERAQAAWLLAQHADRDPVLDRAFLEALRGALAHGEASPAHLACLEDRVRVRAGQPQLYGTQFTVTGGEFGPYLIENPQRLDERRAAAGLEPFAIYQA
jgi:hypothetical protein